MHILEWARLTKRARHIVKPARQGQIRKVSTMEKLSPKEINTALAASNGWLLQGGEIVRSFRFADFVEAMKFVNKVAEIAEAAQHHPDIHINWNQVTLNLSTHDAGGITQKDFDLAEQINGVA